MSKITSDHLDDIRTHKKIELELDMGEPLNTEDADQLEIEKFIPKDEEDEKEFRK